MGKQELPLFGKLDGKKPFWKGIVGIHWGRQRVGDAIRTVKLEYKPHTIISLQRLYKRLKERIQLLTVNI